MNIARMIAAGVLGGGAAVPWYKTVPLIAAYTPIGAASLAASYVNLVSPGTYDLTTNAAPVFSSTLGWQCISGQNNRLVTGIVPSNTVNRYAIVKFAGGDTNNAHRWLFGCNASPSCFFGYKNASSDGTPDVWNGDGTPYNQDANVEEATIVINGLKVYKDGLHIGSISAGASYDQGDKGIVICALNNNGTITQYFLGYIQAFAYGEGTLLTDEQISTLGAALP